METRAVSDFDVYQAEATTFAHYTSENWLPGERTGMSDALYLSTALAGEVGETCNVVKKIARDSRGAITLEQRDALLSEISDVLWYASQLARHFGLRFSEVAEFNLQKLQERYAATRQDA